MTAFCFKPNSRLLIRKSTNGCRCCNNRRSRNHQSSVSQSQLSAYTLEQIEGLSEAFVGGTVGVMSVALIFELKKLNEKSHDACPYCMGNGDILCASCFGSGSRGDGSCPACNGAGSVMCINCKGDGRNTPILLQYRAARDPVSAVTVNNLVLRFANIRNN